MTLRRLIYLSLILFVLACVSPALIVEDTFNSEIETWFGIILLTLGWLAVLVGELAWFANIFLITAWLLTFFKRLKTAFVFALLACVSSLDVIRFNLLEIPANEAGFCCFVLRQLSFGAYFWYASIFVFLLGLGFRLMQPQETDSTNRSST